MFLAITALLTIFIGGALLAFEDQRPVGVLACLLGAALLGYTEHPR